jgi:hypothetical protein
MYASNPRDERRHYAHHLTEIEAHKGDETSGELLTPFFGSGSKDEYKRIQQNMPMRE